MLKISEIAKKKGIKDYYAIVDKKMVLFDEKVHHDRVSFVFSLKFCKQIELVLALQGITINKIEANTIFTSKINDTQALMSHCNEQLANNYIYVYYVSSDENESVIKYTAWQDKNFYNMFVEAYQQLKNVDHRYIGRELDLFHFSNNSPGMAYWHPKGLVIWHCLENLLRKINKEYLCEEIKTPLIAKRELWEKSGHMSKYYKNIMLVGQDVLKPMSCPLCVQVFNRKSISYKDLPIRLTEFGIVHRDEPSGSIHGLFRCKSFVQDDGHIFCTMDQVFDEINSMLDQSFKIYSILGFDKEDVLVKLALRPDEKIGQDSYWDISEKTLEQALISYGVDFQSCPNEGAFYGPKIEFHIRDSMNRSWQCGTIQLDMMMPNFLGAKYVDQNGDLHAPIVIHRAMLGSMERMIGILLEHYRGKLPIWLAPIQLKLISVSQEHVNYVKCLNTKLKNNGIRCDYDTKNESLNYKLRIAISQKIPLIGVIGQKEVKNKTISVRGYDSPFTIDALINKIKKSFI